MGEAGVWIAVMVAGIAVLGAIEYVRANGADAAQWENIKAVLLAGVLLLLGLTALFLSAAYVIFVFLPEIAKEYVIYSVAAFAGIFLLVFATRRGGPGV